MPSDDVKLRWKKCDINPALGYGSTRRGARVCLAVAFGNWSGIALVLATTGRF